MKPATGTVRYKDGILTLTVMRKHGKRMKPLVTTYTVADCRPDPRVASPAFSLTKDDSEVYHVSANEWGVRCDCIDGELREKRGTGDLCKHARSLQACGLMPRS